MKTAVTSAGEWEKELKLVRVGKSNQFPLPASVIASIPPKKTSGEKKERKMKTKDT